MKIHLKNAGILIKILVSAGLIFIVLRRMDFSNLSQAWKNIDWPCFMLAYLLLFSTVIINSLKWKILLEVQKIRLPLYSVMNYYLVGYFFNNFFTGAGEVKRIYDLSVKTGKSHGVTASVFVERWIGVVTQVMVALLALGWAYEDIPRLRNLFIFCGILFFGLLVLALFPGRISSLPFLHKNEKIHRWLLTFNQSYNQYIKHPGALLRAFLLSLAVPFLLVIIHWLLTLGFDYPMGIRPFLIFIPIISVFSQVPVSFSGLGLQEFCFVELLGMAGISPEVAFSVSILSHLLKILTGLPGGVIYILRKDRQKGCGDPESNEPEIRESSAE